MADYHSRTSIDVKPSPGLWQPPEREGSFSILEVIAILGAFLLFGAGVILDHLSEGPDYYLSLVQGCLGKSTTLIVCQNSINTWHEQTHSFAYINIVGAISEGMKAVSIAGVASILISNIFERRNRERLNITLTNRAEAISLNVFEGIFGNSHPPALLETIKRDML